MFITISLKKIMLIRTIFNQKKIISVGYSNLKSILLKVILTTHFYFLIMDFYALQLSNKFNILGVIVPVM